MLRTPTAWAGAGGGSKYGKGLTRGILSLEGFSRIDSHLSEMKLSFLLLQVS